MRGRMKLWFIEPRANVFVSSIKDSVAQSVIDYLYMHCPPDSGVMIFRSIGSVPGYEIKMIGPTRKSMILIDGLQLIVENSQ